MIPEAPLEQTETGVVPIGEGWFVLNAQETRWYHRDGRGAVLWFADELFPQVGVNLFVLEPGEPIGLYHWETDQEDFLVLFGEAVRIIEGDERPLRQWDFVHCPPETKHIIVGAGNGPCAILAIGAREHQVDGFQGGYTVDETARRHGASADRDTTDPHEAYAEIPPHRERTRYRDRWLPRD